MQRFGVTRYILLHIATTAITWATEATDHGHDDLWGRAPRAKLVETGDTSESYVGAGKEKG